MSWYELPIFLDGESQVCAATLWCSSLLWHTVTVITHWQTTQPLLNEHADLFNFKRNRFISYRRQSWRPRRCSSDPQRRIGRASRSECPPPPLNFFSICIQSPPWGSHLSKREGSRNDRELSWESVERGNATKIKKIYFYCLYKNSWLVK